MADLFLSAWDTMQHIPVWHRRGWSVCLRPSQHGYRRLIKTCMGVSAAQWLVCLCASVSTWLPQAHQDLRGSLSAPVVAACFLRHKTCKFCVEVLMLHAYIFTHSSMLHMDVFE